MKKISVQIVFTAALLTFTTLAEGGVPLSRSNDGMNYLFKDPVLSAITAGAYIGQMKREITLTGSSSTTLLTSQRVTGYVGLSLLNWVNVYALAGQNTPDISRYGKSDDSTLLGGGLNVNLLNHFFREPTPMEDAFRLNAGGQYLSTEADFGYTTYRWDEVSAELTLSLVNHIDTNKGYAPESIAIYFGPAYSLISCDLFDVKTKTGLVGGIEIFFTDSFAVDLKVESFGETSVSGGINLHF